MKVLLLIALICNATILFAQNDTKPVLTITGYGELYYSYDFSKPANHEKPGFVYNHKRHNELNANLLLVKANYANENYRANLGLMTGNYAQYNLSSEPTWAQFIYEANVGVKLSKTKNIWFDAGIMPSHIGFESAIGADNWVLTRSLLAEGSPYYETGARISSTSKNEKLYAAVLYLNGWQKISKPNDIQKPSFGAQITYKPTSKLTLNYSSFLGSDKPDSLQSFRHFHNFYLQYEPNGKFGIITGFDIGAEKVLQNKYNTWYTPVVILKQVINNKSKIAMRVEYYKDKSQQIFTTATPNGFQTFGYSANYDYDLNEKIKFRVEAKSFNSKDKIFKAGTSHNNLSLTTSVSIKL